MRWMSLLFLFPTLAWAIPGTIHQEGFLTDARGVPHEGATQLGFGIYGLPEGGAALWSEVHNFNIVSGYYSLLLGEQNAFGDIFEGAQGACVPSNVAQGKPTRQSSGNNSAKAVDGNTSGNYNSGSVTHTGSENMAWWEVDLGESQQIFEIETWNRTDCCANRLSNFYIFVSNTPFASNNAEETRNQAGVWSHHVPGTGQNPTSVEVNQQGRYVRVQLAGTNYLSLAEVVVKACSSTTRYLGVSVDGAELLPRVQLASVPYALQAQNAVGDIHPRSISVGGQQVIDENGNWVGPQVPGAFDGIGYNTPQEALNAIKEVDGANSGLDADLLDGFDSAAFLQNGGQVLALVLAADGAGSGLDADTLDGHDSGAFVRTAAELLALLLTTDGAGSGIDADRLDGHDSTEFINVTDPATAAQLLNLLSTVDGDGSGLDVDALDGLGGEAFLKAADPATAAEILNLLITVDGAGSSLDADLIDGLHASQFMRVDQDASTSGALSVDGPLSGGNANFTGTFAANRVEASQIHTNVLRLIPSNAAPEGVNDGTIYFDNPASEVRYLRNGEWKPMNSCSGGGGGGAVNSSGLVAVVDTGYAPRHTNTVVEKLIDFDLLGINNTNVIPIQVFRDGVEVPSDVVRWFDSNKKAMLRWKIGGAGMTPKESVVTYDIKLDSAGAAHTMPKEFAIHASSDAAPNSFWWAYSNYDGTFGPFTEIGTGYENSDVVIFDKDYDNDYDFAITHDNNGNHGLSIWENDGSENFSKVQTFDSDGNWSGVDVADFNEDGYIDIIANYGYDATANARLYLNDGSGNFAQGPSINPCNGCGWARRVAAGDFNHDGNIDLISGTYTPSGCPICVYWGDGRGGFSDVGTVANSSASHTDTHGMACADVDHDGDDDLFVHKSSRNPLLFRSNGSMRSFENGTASFTNDGWNPNSATSSWYDISIWDVNKDGTLDMSGSDWGNSGRAFIAFGQYSTLGGFPDSWQSVVTNIHTAGTTCMEFAGPRRTRVDIQIRNSQIYKSCLDILNNDASRGDGVYTISPPGLGLTKVYCDMTHNGGGWTLVLSAGTDKEIIHPSLRGPSNADQLAVQEAAQPPNGVLYKFSDTAINRIKSTRDEKIGYWVVTPGSGSSGAGTIGAQSFYRGDCVFQLAQLETELSEECQQSVANTFTDNPDWQPGAHWWFNREGYRWAFGYQVGENGPLAGACYEGGEGLGAHAAPYAPFHRGWCSSKAWGQVWVR